MATTLPTIQKQRGAFYTPEPLARFLVDWAVRSPADRVLDPACGDAVFLDIASDRLRSLGHSAGEDQIVGIEIDSNAADLSRLSVPTAKIITSDFFSHTCDEGEFDAVVGNPPYIRYHHFSGAMRAQALERTLSQGVTLSELTSSWAPFLVHASTFLCKDGRLAFVLPMELLLTDYARPVRAFLERRFSRVDILAFEERVFPEALVDVVLVLAEGTGPGNVQIHRFQNACDLQRFNDSNSRLASGHKWSSALVNLNALDSLERASELMQPLGDIASVDIGIVTGANRFFLLTDKDASAWELPKEDLRPVIARSQQIPNPTLSSQDWAALRDSGGLVWLFVPQSLDPASMRYVTNGESQGVHSTFKCQIRKPWWKLRIPEPPDLILSYMSNRVPHVVENRAEALTTNLLHNVRLKDSNTSARWIALTWMNSATMLSCELSGRAYGGGVLKLETREAERVFVPVYSAKILGELEAVSEKMAALSRERRYLELADIVDAKVLSHLDNEDRRLLRSAWLDMKHRRKRRSLRLKSSPT